MAAETEIFKLSVNPYIGIFKNPSALFKTVLLSPSFSLPKKKADFFVMSNSLNSVALLWGDVAII